MVGLVIALTVGFLLGILLMILLVTGREEEELLERVEKAELSRREAAQESKDVRDPVRTNPGEGMSEGKA